MRGQKGWSHLTSSSTASGWLASVSVSTKSCFWADRFRLDCSNLTADEEEEEEEEVEDAAGEEDESDSPERESTNRTPLVRVFGWPLFDVSRNA
jgi:hypothetical protein